MDGVLARGEHTTTKGKGALVLEALLLAALTLVAASLRLYRLDEVPPGLHGDEALTGLDALRILDEGWIGPYIGHALGQPTGPLYWTALVFKLFGASLFSLRASMAVLGLLTIPVSYLLFRTLFNPRVALVGASLLTFSYWHLHYSRTAFMLISLPLVEALSLLFLFKGFKTNRWAYFPLAGLLLGLGFYTYNVFPLFLLAVALFLIYKLIKGARQWKVLTPRLSVFCLVALISALPFLTFVVQKPEGYMPHFQLSSIFREKTYLSSSNQEKARILAGKMAHAADILFRPGQIDGSDGFGGKPLLDPITGLLFALGMAISAWRWKEDRHFLVLVGIFTGLLGSALSVGGENRRIIGASPFIMLAAGFALDSLWQGVRARVPDSLQVKRWGFTLIVLLALGYVGFSNTNYYFAELVRRPSTHWVFPYDLVKAIQYLGSLDGSTRVYFFSGRWSYNYETRRFLLPRMLGEDRSREFGRFSLDRKNDGPVVYLLMLPYGYLESEIRQRHPGGEYQEFRDEKGRFMFSAYHLK